MNINSNIFELFSSAWTTKDQSIQTFQWITLSVVVVAVLLLLALPYYATIRHLKTRLRGLIKQKDFLHQALNQNNLILCWWSPEYEHISCSHKFLELFELTPDEPVTLADIINRFTPETSLQLSQALNKLAFSQVPFEILAQFNHKSTLIKLQGWFVQTQEGGVATLTAHTMEGPTLAQKFEELTQDYQRLCMALDSLPMAVWFRNLDGKIVYCNAVYAALLEMTPNEVIEQGTEWIPKDRRNSPYHLAVKARTTKLKQTHQQHVVIDGNRRLVELTELPIDVGEFSLGYAQDMTEIENAQEEMQQHINVYQEILQKLSTPVAVYGADKHLQFFNHMYCRLFEFDEAWLYGKPNMGEILEDLRERRKLPEQQNFPAYKKEMMDLFHNLMGQQEFMLHQPDGQIFRTMVAAHPLGGLIFVFEDVTDKLALEQRFNTLIAVQRETIEHLHEGIAVLGSDYRLRLANPALSKLWEIDIIGSMPDPHASELMSNACHLFATPADYEHMRERLFTVLNQRIPQQSRIALNNGRVVQSNYVPLPDGSHLFSFVDISDATRFEQALQERNQALEQAARLKSDFISNVSYELRAPLNTVIGFTEMLINQYFGTVNERQMDYLRTILESGQRLLTLINDMIDLANLEAGQLVLSQQSIQLPTFLNTTLALIYHRANDQGLDVITENKAELEYFIADERRLKQAVYNLLMNAVKFTPAGGSIRLSCFVEQDQLCFSIQDTGVGMSADDKEKLQQPSSKPINFRSRKNSGVGLGLPLVRSLVELHGGRITIESVEGQGTHVNCYIPLNIPQGMISTSDRQALSS